MILKNVTLFPEFLLPLHIFEPRYRRMLSDVMVSHRLFGVAMKCPWTAQEKPMPVVGVGLVRVSVDAPDGTSNLLLLGLKRVRCLGAESYKPYRMERVEVLPNDGEEAESVPVLVGRLRELIEDRLEHGTKGLQSQSLSSAIMASNALTPELLMNDAMSAMGADLADSIQDASGLADYAASTFLTNAMERQAVLETVNVPKRLKKVSEYLAAEIERAK